MTGTVYTETLIHAAPQQFIAEAPYQLIIVTLDVPSAGGRRLTGRVLGEAVRIDDRVELAEERQGIPYFRKI